MATTNKSQDQTLSELNTQWVDGTAAVMLDGTDLVDKAEMVGKLFRITGFKQTVGARDIAYGWVEAELADGTLVEFNDSSKGGIRFQVENYLKAVGKAELLDEWVDVVPPVVCPKGLRVSPHIQKNERGKDVEVKTYYLTTAGRRSRS